MQHSLSSAYCLKFALALTAIAILANTNASPTQNSFTNDTHTSFFTTFPQQETTALNMTDSNTKTLSITSLSSDPRIHLYAWLKSVHAYAQALMPEEDEYGALSLVCDDVTWAALRGNIIPAPTQSDPLNTTTRARPVYNRPTPPLSNDTPAVRAVFKEEKEAYVAYLKARSTLRAALLQSIGPTNKLSMEKALGDLLDVTPDEIYAKMVHDHGQLSMDDINKVTKK